LDALGAMLPVDVAKLDEALDAGLWYQWDSDMDGISLEEFQDPVNGLHQWVISKTSILQQDHGECLDLCDVVAVHVPSSPPNEIGLARWSIARSSRNIAICHYGLVAKHRDRLGTELFGIAFCDCPLPRFAGGQAYFQVLIGGLRPCAHGVPDHKDGLVIGVTTSLPADATSLPECADALPHSWSIGYTGLAVTPDSQVLQQVDWNPTSLQPGDYVGFLVSADGTATLLVNGKAQVTLPGCPVPSDAPLYGFVDLLGIVWSVGFPFTEPPCKSELLSCKSECLDHCRSMESGESGHLTGDPDLVHHEHEAEESLLEVEDSDSEFEASRWHVRDDVVTVGNLEAEESDSEVEESDSESYPEVEESDSESDPEVCDWRLHEGALAAHEHLQCGSSSDSEATESDVGDEVSDTESEEFF